MTSPLGSNPSSSEQPDPGGGSEQTARALAVIEAAEWAELSERLRSGELSICDTFVKTSQFFSRIYAADQSAGAASHALLRDQLALYPRAELLTLASELGRVTFLPMAQKRSEGLPAWERGLQTVRETGDRDLQACYVYWYCGQLLYAGRAADGLALCEAALNSIQVAGSLASEALLAIGAAGACLALGLTSQALVLYETADERLVASGHVNSPVRANALVLSSYIVVVEEEYKQRQDQAIDAARIEGALNRTRQSLDVVKKIEQSVPQVVTTAYDTLARLLLLRGEATAAEQALAGLDALVAAHPGAEEDAVRRSGVTRALVALASGDPHKALACLDRAGEPSDDDDLQNGLYRWWQVRGQTLAHLGRFKEAYEAQRHDSRLSQLRDMRRAEAQSMLALRRLGQQHSLTLQCLSHDLCTPLAASAALASRATADNALGLVPRMAELAAQALHLADRSIDLMRTINAESTALQTLDLRQVVNRACDTALPQAQQRQVTLTRRLEGPAWVHGDAELLERALLNLLTNAIRFSPPGSEVTAQLVADGPKAWLTQVRDQGPGFSPEQLRAAPDVASAVGAARVVGAATRGHGLGLAFVARTATLHNATMRILMAAPHGAQVELRFPAIEGVPEP